MVQKQRKDSKSSAPSPCWSSLFACNFASSKRSLHGGIANLSWRNCSFCVCHPHIGDCSLVFRRSDSSGGLNRSSTNKNRRISCSGDPGAQDCARNHRVSDRKNPWRCAGWTHGDAVHEQRPEGADRAAHFAHARGDREGRRAQRRPRKRTGTDALSIKDD